MNTVNTTDVYVAPLDRTDYDRIADTMPPTTWDFRRLSACAVKWGMELVEMQVTEWECLDEDTRPAVVYVLLGGYQPGMLPRRDEPGYADYYEEVQVWAQDVTETDANPDRFVEVEQSDLRYDDLVETATVRGLSQ